jgi:sporulation protein YtfJ
MANEHKIPEIIRSSMENIRSMVDANTIIGDPIEVKGGTVIIPISKISVGYVSGGLDSVKVEQKKAFAGGGGTGLTVQPVCFIAVHADGNTEVLPVGAAAGTPDKLERIADFVEKTPDILSRIKSVFSKKKKNDDDDEFVEAVADAAAEVAADIAAEKAEQDKAQA